MPNIDAARFSSESMPLAHARVVATADPDDAAEQVGKIFCPHSLTPQGGSTRGFFAVHNSVPLQGYSLNSVAYGGEVDINPGRLEGFFLLQVPLHGSAEVDVGGKRVVSAPGRTATLLSPTRPTRMRWRDGCAQLILLLERSMLEARLSSLLCRDVDELVFDPEVALDGPAGCAIAQQLQQLCEMLEPGAKLEPGEGLEPAKNGVTLTTQTQVLMRESLVAFLLATQRHSYSALLNGEQRVDIAPCAVKRARDFLVANYAKSEILDEMVAHSGASLRTLQVGFRKHYGKTITGYLQDVRLEALRERLLTASGHFGVSDLMLEVGFGHFSRTAGAYRARFGEAPSTTLARCSRL